MQLDLGGNFLFNCESTLIDRVTFHRRVWQCYSQCVALYPCSSVSVSVSPSGPKSSSMSVVNIYICMCVCVYKSRDYEGTQTDRWLANFCAWTYTRVTFVHQLLHVRLYLWWDSRSISSLFKNREEKSSQGRVGKEGDIRSILQKENAQ